MLLAARPFVFPSRHGWKQASTVKCKPNAQPDCLRDGRVLAARALQVHHRAGGAEPSAAAYRDGRRSSHELDALEAGRRDQLL